MFIYPACHTLVKNKAFNITISEYSVVCSTCLCCLYVHVFWLDKKLQSTNLIVVSQVNNLFSPFRSDCLYQCALPGRIHTGCGW